MPLDIFDQENQSGRQVHPMLAQLMQQLMQTPQRQPQQGGPPPAPPLPQAQVSPPMQQGQQQPGLLNQAVGGLTGPMQIMAMLNKQKGVGGGSNTILPPFSGVDNSWWNSGGDNYQPNGTGYQNIYNGPFSDFFNGLGS